MNDDGPTASDQVLSNYFGDVMPIRSLAMSCRMKFCRALRSVVDEMRRAECGQALRLPCSVQFVAHGDAPIRNGAI